MGPGANDQAGLGHWDLGFQGRLCWVRGSMEWSAFGRHCGVSRESGWGVSGKGGPPPSSRCPSYPREYRRVKPAIPKNRTRRRRRRLSKHSSPCSLSRRSAAAALGHARRPGKRGQVGLHPGTTQASPLRTALCDHAHLPGSAASSPAPLVPPSPDTVTSPFQPSSSPLVPPRPTLCWWLLPLTAKEEQGDCSPGPQRLALVARNPHPHHHGHDAKASSQHHARRGNGQRGWGEWAASAPSGSCPSCDSLGRKVELSWPTCPPSESPAFPTQSQVFGWGPTGHIRTDG